MRNFLPLLLIAASVGLFFLHIDPRYESVKNLNKQREQYIEAINSTERLAMKRDELLVKYNSLPKEELAKLERMLPDKLNLVKLIADLDALAGKYGITVSAIKVSEEEADSADQVISDVPPKPYAVTTVSFKFSAPYGNLVNFLEEMEKSLQMIDIKTIAFQNQGGPEQKSTGVFEYEVSFQTYWLR